MKTPFPVRPRARILVVEDHEDMVAMLTMALTHFGYEVHATTTVEGALSLLDRHSYSLVLLDWHLSSLLAVNQPVILGTAVLERCREISTFLPVIVMSGGVTCSYADPSRGEADSFLEKPFHIE